MDKTVILPATGKEREWAARLVAGSEPWITLGTTLEKSLSVCNDPEYQIYIAHVNRKPAGAMIIHPRGFASSPYLKSIVVDEEFRNMGTGRELLEFAEGHFSKSSKHFFLCVSSFNTRAKAFYERLGYRQVGELKDYIIQGASELIMHKRIG